jgi:hypothetical protein
VLRMQILIFHSSLIADTLRAWRPEIYDLTSSPFFLFLVVIYSIFVNYILTANGFHYDTYAYIAIWSNKPHHNSFLYMSHFKKWIHHSIFIYVYEVFRSFLPYIHPLFLPLLPLLTTYWSHQFTFMSIF